MKKLLLIALLIVGCVPITFSNIQSAKIVDKGKISFTPSVSSSINTYNLGVQTAYGLNRKSNLQFRLERIFIDVCDRDDNCENSFYNYKYNLTHLGFGLKYQLKRNKSAIYLPISFTKGDESTDILNILKLFEPTYLHSFTLGKYFEFNPSIKALIPLDSNFKDYLLACNLGFGISSNLSKWVIRPEVGILSSPSADPGLPHMSIGLSIYP